MLEYLARNTSPLSAEDWTAIDNVVVSSASKRLVGRKFIEINGPLGAGVQTVQIPKLAVVDDRFEVKEKLSQNLSIIYKDYKLSWRDIESARQYNMPLELGPVAAASAVCAYKEDELIFDGNKEFNSQGLMNTKGSITVDPMDWKTNGNGFHNIVIALEKLTDTGFYGPFALIMSTSLYALMHRVYDSTGVLEIDMIRDLITDGVFQTPILKGDRALIIATGQENIDLVIAQDLITAYLGPEGMDHLFRVFESIILRVKRPESICVF